MEIIIKIMSIFLGKKSKSKSADFALEVPPFNLFIW